MTQFLNWISNILFSQNENIIHFILIPACFIESAFLYTILMSLLNMNLTHKKNLLYTFFFSIIGVIFFIKIRFKFNAIIIKCKINEKFSNYYNFFIYNSFNKFTYPKALYGGTKHRQ